MIKLNHFYNTRDRISVKWKLCENSKHFHAILNPKSFVKVIVTALPSPVSIPLQSRRQSIEFETKNEIKHLLWIVFCNIQI